MNSPCGKLCEAKRSGEDKRGSSEVITARRGAFVPEMNKRRKWINV